jgi:septum formation protein
MASELPTTDPVSPRLVLASASRSRAALLDNAGVAVDIRPADLDESIIKEEMLQKYAEPAAIAQALADAKAMQVSARQPGSLVLGADQVLVCEGRLFDKPVDNKAAAETLRALAGRRHDLISAVAVARAGAVIWRHQDRARLWMRHLSEDDIAWYLGRAGADVLSSVGAYQLEGLGARLFERIEGDFFTILGLPLLAVLDFLRGHGIVRP